jgi:hypothetical protein
MMSSKKLVGALLIAQLSVPQALMASGSSVNKTILPDEAISANNSTHCEQQEPSSEEGNTFSGFSKGQEGSLVATATLLWGNLIDRLFSAPRREVNPVAPADVAQQNGGASQPDVVAVHHAHSAALALQAQQETSTPKTSGRAVLKSAAKTRQASNSGIDVNVQSTTAELPSRVATPSGPIGSTSTSALQKDFKSRMTEAESKQGEAELTKVASPSAPLITTLANSPQKSPPQTAIHHTTRQSVVGEKKQPDSTIPSTPYAVNKRRGSGATSSPAFTPNTPAAMSGAKAVATTADQEPQTVIRHVSTQPVVSASSSVKDASTEMTPTQPQGSVTPQNRIVGVAVSPSEMQTPRGGRHTNVEGVDFAAYSELPAPDALSTSSSTAAGGAKSSVETSLTPEIQPAQSTGPSLGSLSDKHKEPIRVNQQRGAKDDAGARLYDQLHKSPAPSKKTILPAGSGDRKPINPVKTQGNGATKPAAAVPVPAAEVTLAKLNQIYAGLLQNSNLVPHQSHKAPGFVNKHEASIRNELRKAGVLETQLDGAFRNIANNIQNDWPNWIAKRSTKK